MRNSKRNSKSSRAKGKRKSNHVNFKGKKMPAALYAMEQKANKKKQYKDNKFHAWLYGKNSRTCFGLRVCKEP